MKLEAAFHTNLYVCDLHRSSRGWPRRPTDTTREHVSVSVRALTLIHEIPAFQLVVLSRRTGETCSRRASNVQYA